MKFDEDTIQRVWEHARATNDQDPTQWRKDECGAWIKRADFGERDSEFGWKIEDTVPGTPADPDHLRPFHNANSFDIANRRAHCRVSADRREAGPRARLDRPRNSPIRG